MIIYIKNINVVILTVLVILGLIINNMINKDINSKYMSNRYLVMNSKWNILIDHEIDEL